MSRLLWLALLAGVFAWALWLRAAHMDVKPFTTDEAETTINALTILQHGYPTDTYLGLPLYENALIEPWPESEEYEFRDSSYSRGMPVYHGWLPFYSVAAALALARVGPSEENVTLGVQRSPAEIRRMTVAARAPSLVFSLVFLALLFRAGFALGGSETAWAALILGAFFEPAIVYSRAARYYSAALALGCAAGLLLWCLVRATGWARGAAAALAFVLVFHTHTLTFAALCGLALAMLPRLRDQPQGVRMILVLALLVAIAVVPWAFISGLADKVERLPMAPSILRFPTDLVDFLMASKRVSFLLLLALLVFPAMGFLRGRLPARLVDPFRRSSASWSFLATWLVLAYLVSTFLIPAASLWLDRLYLIALPPAVLLVALTLSVVVRSLALPYPTLSAGLLALLTLVGTGTARFVTGPGEILAGGRRAMLPLIETLRSWPVEPGTRLYATPNDHLVLTAYTGLPVQSIAPIRKSYLDSYPGRILLVQCVSPYEPMSTAGLRRAARAQGVELSEESAREWATRLGNRLVREDLTSRVLEVFPPLEEIPRWASAALADERGQAAKRTANAYAVTDSPPIFRGYELRTMEDWWPVFFYRFVGPERRMGQHLNFADRIRSARATVLPSSWVIFDCPPRRQEGVRLP